MLCTCLWYGKALENLPACTNQLINLTAVRREERPVRAGRAEAAGGGEAARRVADALQAAGRGQRGEVQGGYSIG